MYSKRIRGKARITLIALAVFTFGCAHTHKIHLNSEPSTFNEINAILKSQKARITLATGSPFIGEGPQIARDSTFWFDPGTTNRHTVSTSEVRNIVTLKRGRGALEGLKYGALIGAAAGLVIGVIFGTEDAEGFGPKITMAGLIFVGAIDGGLLGLPIGAIAGSKDKYILVAPADSALNSD